MTPLITKLKALLETDPQGQPLAPETRSLIEEAVMLEKMRAEPVHEVCTKASDHFCHRCGDRLRGSDAAIACCGALVACGLCRDDMRNGR